MLHPCWKDRAFLKKFIIITIVIVGIRLALSIMLIWLFQGVFTLSADDIFRLRVSLLWAKDPSFFPDTTWPPLQFWLGGLLYSTVIPYDMLPLNVLSIICSIISILLLGVLTSDLFDVDASHTHLLFSQSVVMLVFTLFPRWLWLGSSMLSEPIYIVLFLLTLYAFRCCITQHKMKWAYLVLVIGSLSLLVRFEGIAFVGLIYFILIWHFWKERKFLVLFVPIGAILLAWFPVAWVLFQIQSANGIAAYLENLQGGFSSRIGMSGFQSMSYMFFLYLRMYTPCLLLILVGAGIALQQWKHKQLPTWVMYELVIVIGYLIAQFICAFLEIMPSHSLWRLTVPVYVMLLPYLGFALYQIAPSISRLWLIPAVLVLFQEVTQIPKPPVFVSKDLSDIGINLQQLNSSDEESVNTLIEVKGWDWLYLSLCAGGMNHEGVHYDISNLWNQTNAQSLFDETFTEIKNFLQDENIGQAVVLSQHAKQTLNQLNWKVSKSNDPYTIYIREETP